MARDSSFEFKPSLQAKQTPGEQTPEHLAELGSRGWEETLANPASLQRWYLTRRFLPKSAMGKAISYALAQWESLEIYLKEAGIEIE
jgi:hypothetical protein